MARCASISAPILATMPDVNMVLAAQAACLGGLFFSYFNDSYFWVVNRLLGVKTAKHQLLVLSVPTTLGWATGLVALLIANLLLQLVAVVLLVLLLVVILRNAGLASRVFAFVVPFLWVENVQHLVGGLIQNLVILTGDGTMLILLTPLIFWTVYWLWRIGRDQLGRGGWFATGLLFLSFVIDAGLFLFVQSRVQIPLG